MCGPFTSPQCRAGKSCAKQAYNCQSIEMQHNLTKHNYFLNMDAKYTLLHKQPLQSDLISLNPMIRLIMAAHQIALQEHNTPCLAPVTAAAACAIAALLGNAAAMATGCACTAVTSAVGAWFGGVGIVARAHEVMAILSVLAVASCT